MKKIKYETMILRRKIPAISKGKFIKETQEFEILVMAIVDGYAMVKRPKSAPFIVSAKDLQDLESKNEVQE